MPTPRLRLGQLLVDAKLITAAALDEALQAQRTDGRRLGTLLVERGLVNETQLTQILSHQLSVPWVSLLHIEFSRQLLNLVPHDVADRFCLVPIYVRHVRNQGDTLYVAMDDPSNDDGLRACREHSGLPVRAMIAPPADIRNAIRVYYGIEPTRAPQPVITEGAPKGESTPPAVTLREPKAVVVAPAEPATVIDPQVAAEPAIAAEPVIAAEPAIAADLEAEGSIASELGGHGEPEIAADPGLAIEPEGAADPAAAAAHAALQSAMDGPEIEAVEIDIDQARADRLRAALEEPGSLPPPSEPAVENIPRPRGRAPRMVSLTLLDGTTINLPAKRRARPRLPDEERAAAPPSTPAPSLPSEPPGPDAVQGLTARDLVLALRVVAHGADASEVLGSNVRWESLFAALLSLMLKKHLIADWEFVDELKKNL